MYFPGVLAVIFVDFQPVALICLNTSVVPPGELSYKEDGGYGYSSEILKRTLLKAVPRSCFVRVA